MIHWNAEADTYAPALTGPESEAHQPDRHAVPQRQRDDLYGLHNFIVLDDLLKRHLNLN